MFAPALAREKPVRGIVVFGTPHAHRRIPCCTEMKTVQADVGDVQLKADTTEPPGQSRAGDRGYRTEDEKRHLVPERTALGGCYLRACRGKHEEGKQSRRPETD